MMQQRGINRRILAIAVPAIVSNITVPLLSLCDTAVTGHLGSEIYLGAIAVGGSMIQVIFWVFGFLRMGTTGLTAQSYGRRDASGCSLLFSRALLLAVFIGLLAIALQSPLLSLLLSLTGPAGEIRDFAALYFRVCIWSAPALLGSMTVCGWFLGMQDSKRPMIITISANLINVILSVALVYGCRMGFAGAPAGTLIANWCSLAIALLLVRRRNGGRLPLAPWSATVALDGLGRFFRVNSDIFLRSLCIMAVTLSFTAFGTRLGARTLAVNALMLQFFFLYSHFMDGFAFAAEALTGDAKGGGDAAGMRRITRALMLWTVALAAGFSLLYFAGFRPFADLLTSQKEVVADALHYRGWVTALPWLACMAFLFDGFFIGVTATRAMLLSAFVATAAFFLSELLLTPMLAGGEMTAGLFGRTLRFDGNDILWFSFLLYLFFRGVLLSVWWKVGKPYR